MVRGAEKGPLSRTDCGRGERSPPPKPRIAAKPPTSCALAPRRTTAPTPAPRHPVSAPCSTSSPPPALHPHLAKSPTFQQANKSKSWQVGTRHQQGRAGENREAPHRAHPAALLLFLPLLLPALAALPRFTPPVDLTRLNPPLPAALAYTCTHPVSARRCCRIVHTSSHPRLSVFSPPERSPPLPRLTPGVNQETTRTPPVRW